MDSNSPPYHTQAESGKFNVMGPTDRVIMTCRDEASARHYAALLCQAYQQGYQDGYRVAKQPDR